MLPPEPLVELETSVVLAAAAGLENANISPATAKTVGSATRAPRSVADCVVCLVRVRRARSLTGVIVASSDLGSWRPMHAPSRSFFRDVGRGLTASPASDH